MNRSKAAAGTNVDVALRLMMQTDMIPIHSFYISAVGAYSSRSLLLWAELTGIKVMKHQHGAVTNILLARGNPWIKI
jgi:hypothetical protein